MAKIDTTDALSVCYAFVDTEGWNDNTLVLLLTDYINSEKLGAGLLAYLATRQSDESLDSQTNRE